MQKVCMFCDKVFETSYYLPDGRRVRCDKRTKCWDCLPRDRKKLVRGVESSIHIGETIVCSRCGLKFKYFDLEPTENRYCQACRDELNCSKCLICGERHAIRALQTHSGFHNLCRSCVKKNKNALTKFKCAVYLGGCCKKCGWKECLLGLEFHHRDDKEKSFTINENYTLSWSRLKEELDKCDLLCANCHRLAHYNCTAPLHHYLKSMEASFDKHGRFSLGTPGGKSF